jgi:chemotaxis protein CheZ
MFDDLRRFVDRRIAELSAELHGAVQMVDYSEANISGQIARMHEQIANLVGAPTAATRNSGMELEAVVQATESAANRIMEAAEAIGDWLASGAHDSESVQLLGEKVNAIFEACTFQDLTGQRIRRAIEHLQHVESMLGGMMRGDEPAAAAPPPKPGPVDAPETSGPDLGQSAVDALFD